MNTAVGPALPDSLSERSRCRTAQFATRWVHPQVAVVVAEGELDAANTDEFVAYALQRAARAAHIVVDLTDVDFFGTAAFTALHEINAGCAMSSTVWMAVPSPAALRLLRICDPDSVLPISPGIDAALSTLQRQGRLLELIPKPR